MSWSIKNLMFHDKPVPLANQRDLGFSKVWVYCSDPDCRHSAVLERCVHGMACARMKCGRRTSEKCPELTMTSRSNGIGFTFRSSLTWFSPLRHRFSPRSSLC